jgi:hypothetical protein
MRAASPWWSSAPDGAGDQVDVAEHDLAVRSRTISVDLPRVMVPES